MLRISVLTALLAILALPASAKVTSKSGEVVVLQQSDLPEASGIAGESMQLHESSAGRTYLYIEQQHGHRLLILDVSEPSKIHSVGLATLEVDTPFEFVREVGTSSVLICFQGGHGSAILDLRKPKQPTLLATNSLLNADDAEPLGNTALLAAISNNATSPGPKRDYQVIDTSDPYRPSVLWTVGQVRKILTNSATGTTFILSAQGLIVLRRPYVESENRDRATAN